MAKAGLAAGAEPEPPDCVPWCKNALGGEGGRTQTLAVLKARETKKFLRLYLEQGKVFSVGFL